MHPVLARVALLLALATLACGDDGDPGAPNTTPTAADRARFVGTWGGSYACPGGPTTPDTLVVSAGAGPLDVRLVLHRSTINPDTVTGALAAADRITVPSQRMGGLPGTAQLTLSGTRLDYRQSGLGITCGGADYTRAP